MPRAGAARGACLVQPSSVRKRPVPPNPQPPRPTLGQHLHATLGWGAGTKLQSKTTTVFAAGSNHPSDADVTWEDIARLVELARERYGK
jgi:hypothetical protein